MSKIAPEPWLSTIQPIGSPPLPAYPLTRLHFPLPSAKVCTSGRSESAFDCGAPSDRSCPGDSGRQRDAGSTIDGESIDLNGDVDEFTFGGSSGQLISGAISAPLGLGGGSIVLEIVDPANDTVLGSAATNDATVVSTGGIVLPATRTYTARVRGLSDTDGKGTYRFSIQ